MTCSLAEFPIFCKGNSEKGLKDLIFNRACAILKTINATLNEFSVVDEEKTKKKGIIGCTQHLCCSFSSVLLLLSSPNRSLFSVTCKYNFIRCCRGNVI